MGSAVVATGDQQSSRLQSARSALAGWFADQAAQLALVLTLLVTIHAVAASVFLPAINPYKSLERSENTSTAVTIHLGLAAAAAIVAGFAGVIIVFTIGSAASRIRQFRFAAGRALQRSWMTVVVEPFLATLLGIVAAVAQTTSGGHVAPWLFELGVVLLGHGAIRLVWLLHNLVGIVYAEDHDVEEKAHEVPTESLFP